MVCPINLGASGCICSTAQRGGVAIVPPCLSSVLSIRVTPTKTRTKHVNKLTTECDLQRNELHGYDAGCTE